MKEHTTKSKVYAQYGRVVWVGYCDLQRALNLAGKEPEAYTARAEGWAADIYDCGEGVALVTGYAPFGRYRLPYEFAQLWERRALAISEKAFDRTRAAARKAARAFGRRFLTALQKEAAKLYTRKGAHNV